MKKISVFILAGMFSCLQTMAQTSCIAAPDSLGKYLATVFLQKGDISKTAVFPDKQAISLIQNLRAEGIIQESTEAATDVSGTEGQPAQYLATLWEQLLTQATLKKITAANSVYDQTYFSVHPLEQDKSKNYYIIYIAFRKDNIPFAIEINALTDQKKWMITYIGNAIFKPVNRRKNELSFTDQNLLPGSVKPEINQEAIPQADLSGTCLSQPGAFITKIVQQLTAHKPIAGFSGLLTEADFKAHALPDFIQLLNKAIKAKGIPAADLKEIKTMLDNFQHTPGFAYKKQLTDDVSQLSDYLYTAKITAAAVETTSYSIKNYEQEVWTGGKTILEADVTFKTSEGKEGIRFDALWLNGQWQVISMQSTTYGISEAN